jgi:hypothetical protein
LWVIESFTGWVPTSRPTSNFIDETRDVVAQLAIVFTASAFEVHGNRNLNSPGDPRDNLLGEPDWDGFAVPVTVCLRNRPAACRDRVERRETCCFFGLFHFIRLHYRTVAVAVKKN